MRAAWWGFGTRCEGSRHGHESSGEPMDAEQPYAVRSSMDPNLRCVYVASGEIQAQQIRAFLQAVGISSIERGEALRNTHGLTIDGLGAVEILVAEGDADLARSLLEAADAGAFRLAEDVENS